MPMAPSSTQLVGFEYIRMASSNNLPSEYDSSSKFGDLILWY